MGEAGHEGPLAEYASLRGEIDSRAKFQQQILALQLTLTSAIFGFALSRAGLVGLLLIVPVSSYLLCGRYVAQRTAIRWVSSYIGGELSARIPGGLGWVAWSRANRRPDRLLDWLVPLMLSFPGASALALAWTLGAIFVRGSEGWPLKVVLGLVWAAGAFGTAVTARMLLRIFREPAAPAPQ
jgi:hypothetical protein